MPDFKYKNNKTVLGMSLADKFFKLFAGLLRSHGTYAMGDKLKADSKGKLTGARKTVHQPVTVELWEKHLSGTYAIGVVPIREDSTCRFGAIDIDIYDIDLKKLNKKVQQLNLPLIVCRTKSGGAHLYLFIKEATSAETVRHKLMQWAIGLGHAGVEVFPKQTRLASATDPVEDSTGNWINMPYAGGEFSTRYAHDPKTGEALTPEQFLELADQMALADGAELEAIELPETEHSDLLRGAPPCMILGADRGFGDWDNTMLFNFGVYTHKRYGEDFEAPLAVLNEKFLETPLRGREFNTVVNSIRKKNYSYTCNQDPIVKMCDKKACKLCDYGVGVLPDNPGVTIGAIIKLKTDPVTWIVEVNDARLETDTPTLMDQRKFHARVFEVLSLWPSMIKPGTWKKMISEKALAAENVDVPEDATREGQLWVQLSRFCTSRVMGKALDEVLMGKPYTDETENLTYFQGADYFQYLQQHRVAGITEREVWKFLHRRGANHVTKTLKGKTVKLWTMPSFSKQTEEHSVPRVPKPETM